MKSKFLYASLTIEKCAIGAEFGVMGLDHVCHIFSYCYWNFVYGTLEKKKEISARSSKAGFTFDHVARSCKYFLLYGT